MFKQEMFSVLPSRPVPTGSGWRGQRADMADRKRREAPGRAWPFTRWRGKGQDVETTIAEGLPISALWKLWTE
ncbi:MAG: hypothetical protein Fues2KO_16930 [Fuerstiella sp.]